MRSRTRVAIIGGGISGLACGRELVRGGVDVVIFDTGKRTVGGRCSSRKSAGMLIDHSAQILTSSTTAFKEECTRLQAAGVIKRMQGTVGLLDMSSQAVKLEYFSGGDEDSRGHYVGVGGMDHIAAHLADEIIQGGGQFVRPAWVSAMKQPQDKSTKNAESKARRWLLSNKGQWTDTAEAFEYVVIAHNGKCADNLLKKTIPPGETLSFIFLVFFVF